MEIKDGDVFYWHYKNDEEYRKSCPNGTTYWCMDNRCVVVNGELLDTYWSGVESKYYSSSTKSVDFDKVDLEFICNVGAVRFIQKYEIEDYDKVYNLSHQKGCYPCYAVDKDAKVSNKALLVKYRRKLEEAEFDMRSAVWNIEKYKELIEEIGE